MLKASQLASPSKKNEGGETECVRKRNGKKKAKKKNGKKRNGEKLGEKSFLRFFLSKRF